MTNNGGIGITHPLELEIVFTKKKTDMTPEDKSMYGYNQWRMRNVDMAVVFTKDDILFDNFVGGSNNDGEDFDFINKYKEKYGNKIVYKDIVMSYYNKLDWSVEEKHSCIRASRWFHRYLWLVI